MSPAPAKTGRSRGSKTIEPARSGAKVSEPSNHSETRLQIIDAAKRCFAEHGYGGTTNKMLAVAAGVAPGLIYYYFESKEQVFIAVFDQMYQSRNARLSGYNFSDHTLSENLATMLEDSVKLAHEDPSFVDVFTLSGREVSRNPGLEEAWKTHWDHVVHAYFRIVEAAADRGEIPSEHKVGLVDMLVAFFSGLLMWVSRQPDELKTRQATDQFVRMIDAYVGATKADKRTSTGIRKAPATTPKATAPKATAPKATTAQAGPKKQKAAKGS